MKIIALTKNRLTFVDDADYDELKKFNWHARWQGNRYYASTSAWLDDGTFTFSMHTLLMMPDRGEVVDHIDGNSLNNTRANLRICSQSDNLRNRAGYGVSQHKYVYYRSSRNKPWIARVYDTPTKKNTHVGSFSTEAEAHEAVAEFLSRPSR